jgi:signal transduction histidine kinase/CheY-like chemotaxis protein
MARIGQFWQWESARIIRYLTIFCLLCYIGVSLLYFLVFVPNTLEGLLRIIFCLVLCTVLIAINFNRRTPRPVMAWAGSLLAVILETVLAIAVHGDPTYFIFIVVWEVVSFVYLEPVGFLICLTFSNLVIIPLLFLFHINPLGPAFPWYAAYAGLFVYELIGIILYFISRLILWEAKDIDKTSRTFETIMKTTPSYMVVINENAEVEFISASLIDQFGIGDRRYAENRPLLDLFSSGELKMRFQEFMEQPGYVEDTFEAHIRGKTYWFMLRSSPLEENQLARFFEWMDITPIMEAKNEAESAARAKNDFLTNMSHEIRTPMNAVIGMTDLMLTNPLEPEQMTRADTIKSAALSLLNIINDILDYSKIDAQKMEILPRPFDIASLINDTVNMISIKTNTAGLSFTTLISKDIPPEINSDELRLKQCLVNLLNNAVKFTRKGYIQLQAWAEPLPQGGLKLHFAVRDTGIGIKQTDMGRLFGEFEQLDTRKNRNIEGTGLGLAITRRLVELMGGEIRVESVYGEGSVFSFYVLCEGPHQGHLVEIARPEELRALCFEPRPYNARTFRDMLKDLDVPAEVCVDINKARALLQAGTFTHVFFDRSGIDDLREFMDRDKTVFTMLKEVPDKYERHIPNAMNRPVLIMALADILNGKNQYERRRVWDEEEAAGSFMTRGVQVLVVDDNAVNLMVASGLLKRYGIAVETAAGGKEALQMVRQQTYDLIFMDHMMPGMDGLDTTKAIRALGGPYAEAIIIALTANAMAGVEEQFIAAGMNGFLSKPIIIKNLREILINYLPPEKILST